jgi:hypothetical protein
VTKLFNSVIGKRGKVYAALLGQLAVQGAEVNVLGHSEMCAADILMQNVCLLIYKDPLSVVRLRSRPISSALKMEAARFSWTSLSMLIRILCEHYLPWKPANL